MKRIYITIMISLFCVYASAQITRAKHDWKENKCGFVDANGKWIVPPIYEHTYWYEDWKVGTYKTADAPEFPGLLDETGKIIFQPGTYTSYYVHKEFGHIEIEDVSHKKGLATMDGKIIIPCMYDEIFENKSYDGGHYIQVTIGNKVGLLTPEGKNWVPCNYQKIYAYGGYIEVTDLQNRVGLLTKEGKSWVPCKYKDIFVSTQGSSLRAEVTDDIGYVGLLDKEGKTILPCKFQHILISEREQVIEVKKNGKIGAYTLDGSIIAECQYDRVLAAGKDLVLVNKGGRDGGKENHYKFIGGKWGYAANGKEIIPCQYDEASEFVNDVATVKKDGEVKLIKNPLKDGSQIMIAEGGSGVNNKKKVGGPAVSRYPAPDSDVDKDIPTAKNKAENTFAFIIANENYPDAPVPYSLNDGRMFKEYCQKALGLPEKNINLYEDATFGNIITAVEKMKQVANAYDGDASVIFYYAGHGFPDDKQQTAYLLPIDGDASSITSTGYSLAKLYKEIAGLKMKSAVVFLDACFSGAKREDQMLASSRGVAIKVKEEAPQGKMLVFSAAQGDETAHQLEDKHHGLFTYYLLKELQQTGGDVNMGTLTEYVTKQVKRQSVVINNKKQTPTVIPSQALQAGWQTMKLR